MPVVNVNLLVDDKTYAGVKAGVLELCGMAKNVDNKRVAKHIPAVADAAKEGASKAIDFIRLHKKGTVRVRITKTERRPDQQPWRSQRDTNKN